MTHKKFIGQVLAETKKAILFHVNKFDKPIWFPKSIISLYRNSKDTCEIIVPVWFTNKLSINP